MLLYNVGLVVGGSASSANIVILGRAIAGAGGMAVYPGVLQIISAVTTRNERPLWISIAGTAFITGLLSDLPPRYPHTELTTHRIGPIIGGALANSSATWRWALYLPVCVSGVFAPVAIYLTPRSRFGPDSGSLGHRIRTFDFLGSLLWAGSLAMFFIAVACGGTLWKWDSSRSICLFSAAGVMFVLFGLQQSFCILTDRKNRLLPVDLLTTEVGALTLITHCSITLVYIPVYILPLFYQFARGSNPLVAGTQKLPHIGAVVFAMMFATVVYKKHRAIRLWFIIGTALMLIGSGLLTIVDSHSSNAKVYGFSVLLGLGAGMTAQLVFAVVQDLYPQRILDATSLFTAAQCSVGGFGINIATAMFVNIAIKRIAKAAPDLAPGTIVSLIAGVDSASLNALPEDVREKIISAIISALRDDYILCCVIAGVAFLVSFLVSKEKPVQDEAVTTPSETKEAAKVKEKQGEGERLAA